MSNTIQPPINQKDYSWTTAWLKIYKSASYPTALFTSSKAACFYFCNF